MDKIPLAVQLCPKGSSPQGMSEAMTKSQLHSPFREQQDLVIAIRDQKTAKFAKKSIIFVGTQGNFGEWCFREFQ